MTLSPLPPPVSSELRDAVTALRLLAEGVHDGLVDLRPGSADSARLVAQVRLLADLLAPREDAVTRRRPGG